jgi:NTP pyrophosphatase (non-canonical NTP hydrolase)
MPDTTSDSNTTVRELRDAIARFVRERDWERFHDPKNLAMSIAIEAAELMEPLQWARSDEVPARLADPSLRQALTDELADVVCYVLSLANRLDIDLASAVLAKVERNARKYPAERFRGRYE